MLNKKRFSKFLFYFFLTLGAAIMFIPYWFMIVLSFEGPQEAAAIPPHFFPHEPIFSNYIRLFSDQSFGIYFINTILITVSLTLGQVILCAMAGYTFARLYIPLKNFVFFAFLIVMMLPGVILLIPRYLIARDLNLIDSLSGIIIFELLSVFGIFLFRQHILTLPLDLEEAAVIDGANIWQIFWRIVMPLTKTLVSSFGLLVFIYAWKLFLWPLIIISSPEKYTLTLALAQLQGRYFSDYGMMMAGATVSTIPIVILFVIFQNQIIDAIAFSGLKQ